MFEGTRTFILDTHIGYDDSLAIAKTITKARKLERNKKENYVRNKHFKITGICYLCGLSNPNTKDHVPPQGLFSTTRQRLTLPAHEKCNIEFSKDEEYFRDVIVQQAVAFKMTNTEVVTAKIWKSWNAEGKNRYKELISSAKPHLFKYDSGKLENAITINPNRKRIENVVKKIARGILYNDTGVVTTHGNYHTAYIPSISLLEVKNRDKEDLYWQAMSSKECMHTEFGPNFGARRLYIYSKKEPPTISCFMGLILGSAFYIVITDIPFNSIRNEKLQYFR